MTWESVYKYLETSIILIINSGRYNALPLRLKDYPFPYHHSWTKEIIVQEVLANKNKARKINKGHTDEKGKNKTALICKIIYVESHEDSTKLKENSRTNVSSVSSQYTRPTHKQSISFIVLTIIMKRKK